MQGVTCKAVVNSKICARTWASSSRNPRPLGRGGCQRISKFNDDDTCEIISYVNGRVKTLSISQLREADDIEIMIGSRMKKWNLVIILLKQRTIYTLYVDKNKRLCLMMCHGGFIIVMMIMKKTAIDTNIHILIKTIKIF